MVKTLNEELEYNYAQLRKQKVPAYYMSLRMADEYTLMIQSSFGASSVNEQRMRTVTPQIRIGNMELDNYKYTNQGTSNPSGRNAEGVRVPIDGKPLSAVREAIWKETLNRYNIAQRNYNDALSRMKTSVANEDNAPCFSKVPVEKYYEAELPASAYNFDKKAWAERLNAVSKVFKENDLLEGGSATIAVSINRTWLVTSEGSIVVQNNRGIRVMLSGSIKATDGMACPLSQDFFAFSAEDLPSQETLIATAHDMVKRLLALRDAPIVDPYTGPAILSGPASGVFFHEIFGHRLEGHRLKTGGETFKKKVGEKVLPETFNVFCDPTLEHYNNTILYGHYNYDEEGVKSSRVDNVVNGVLRNFLMSRVPLDGFPTSNGHGRSRGGNDPVSRQSNLIVETSKPYTEAQLRQMLIAEAKKQDKEFGYYFRTVTSGYTLTGEGNSLNSFNVSPVEVYRVFVDGREDQLVRGVDLIGTPLSMFSNIVAAGDTPSTFTGECGAESGWVPVTATSPMIFVSQVETQRSKAQRQVPMILERPERNSAKIDTDREADIITKAMADEMQRAKDMTFAGTDKPYLVDYRIARVKQFNINSKLGGTIYYSSVPIRTIGSVNVILGDSTITSEMKPGECSQLSLPHDVDYDILRSELWKATDYMYKHSINSLSSKKNYFAQRPRRKKEAEVPDMFATSAKEYFAPSVLDGVCDGELLEALANKLSAVFCDYPMLYDTQIAISSISGDAYRHTSDGLNLRLPVGNIILDGIARVKCADGSVITDNWKRVLNINAQLPDSNVLVAEIKEFAEQLIAQRDAEVVSEYYCGPMMFEGGAVISTFSRSVITPLLMASRGVQEGSGRNSQMRGKHIIDTKLNIVQLADTKTYKGTSLIGSYDIDVDGRSPKALSLVENGILRTILCGSHPSVGCDEPTGNERFFDNVDRGLYTHSSPGNLRIYSNKTRQQSSMVKALIKEAREDGLDYAYIVRANNGSNLKLFRIDVKSGEETLVRVKSVPVANRSELMHLTDISRDEQVVNSSLSNNRISIVAPQSIIVESVEYNFEEPQPELPFIINIPNK